MAKDSKKERYISSLIKELEYHKDEVREVKTIYIGGGTPTSLSLELLERLLQTIHSTIDMSNVIEFSIESNPNDYNINLINLLKKYSVNRVSIGVQTFNEKQLEFLGRTHTRQDVYQSISLLRDHGFTNISIDMIFSLVDQTESDLEADLNEVLNLDIDHISYYSLILEEKSKLYYLLTQNKISMNSEDLEGIMYNKVIDTLEENGFIQYEISNFTNKGLESLHNKTYWNNEEYLGIGSGSHSMYDNTRFYNITNVTKYIEKIEQNDFNFTTSYEYDSLNEEMMLGLRLTKGININKINEKYNIDIFQTYPKLLEFIKDGLLEVQNDYISFTRKGILVGNIVFQLFVEVS